MKEWRFEWIYWMLILGLCILLIYQKVQYRKKGSLPRVSYQIQLENGDPSEINFSEAPIFRIVIIITPKDCGSCLGIIQTLNRLSKNYPKSDLKCLGIFMGDKIEFQKFNKLSLCQFPLYNKDTTEFMDLMIQYGTPLVLLYDQSSRLRYIQPPSSSPSIQQKFAQIVNDII